MGLRGSELIFRANEVPERYGKRGDPKPGMRPGLPGGRQPT
jgi:hypothetical protein